MEENILEDLLILAKHYKMSDEEMENQRRSFAYGNTKLSNDEISRPLIDKIANKL